MYADQSQQDLMDQVQIQPDHIARYWRLWWRRFSPRLDRQRRRDLFEQTRHPERFRRPIARKPGSTAWMVRRQQLEGGDAIWVRWQHFGVPLWPSEAYLASADPEARHLRAQVPLPPFSALYARAFMGGLKLSGAALLAAMLLSGVYSEMRFLNNSATPMYVEMHGRSALVQPGDCAILGPFLAGPHTLVVQREGEETAQLHFTLKGGGKGAFYSPLPAKNTARLCRD